MVTGVVLFTPGWIQTCGGMAIAAGRFLVKNAETQSGRNPIMDQQADKTQLVELTADIVAAYVSKNNVQRSDLPSLIADVHKALSDAVSLASGEPAKPEQPQLTSQQIKRSITPDHLVSFEDGKRYKTLRRHLSVRGLTPQAYREKWGLPVDYPMAAPAYSQQRSELARSIGLGQKRGGGLAKVSAEDALKVEAFEEVTESAEGEAGGDDAVLLDVAAVAEVSHKAEKPKRAAASRAKKAKGEKTPA